MTFEKRRLAGAEMGYAVDRKRIAGEVRPIVASEAKGPAVVFEGAGLEPRVLATEPGGTMGFAEVPGRDDALFVITGFYPIFRAESAGIHLYRAVDGLARPWSGERIVELPFVHRILTVSGGGRDYLIAATVCGGKENADDWSRPGTVFAYEIGAGLAGPWEARPDLESIHRNHGLWTGIVDGVASVLVSGTEGVFALALPGESGADGGATEPWRASRLIDHDVIALGLIDLDGDGEDELVTVEPFHGNELAVYKRDGDGWNKVCSSELAFGHGLTVGRLNGEPVAVVGNRAGSKDLLCFRVASTDPITLEPVVVDHGAATAGTTITPTPRGDAIVSSNPEFAEYALYVAK